MGSNFAGNIASGKAWDILCENKASSLIDVRTLTELKFVGSTDLSSIGKRTIELPIFDESGNQNVNFIQELEGLALPKDAPIIFICHGGGRSMQAAMVAAQMGYEAFNFENGFCGAANEKGHRSRINGWVADDLPWRQA